MDSRVLAGLDPDLSSTDGTQQRSVAAEHHPTDLTVCPLVQPRLTEAAQEPSTTSACGLWPVTCRQPALGTNIDDDPESQRTVISRPSTSVTTPLRVTAPTFSDSTSTRSPTSTMSTSPLPYGTRPIKCPHAANRPQEVPRVLSG